MPFSPGALFLTRAAAAILAAGMIGQGARARPPRRIVSMNVCADQLVLVLADRAQIAAVTRNATDPEMSAEVARAQGIRAISRSAEEVLEIDPDLIVGAPMRRDGVMAVIADHHYPMVDLPPADTYGQIVAQIRRVAEAVGHADRGEALVRRMDQALAAIPRDPRGGVAAYYQRRGFLTGAGTLVDELMGRVGLTNLAVRLRKPILSQMSLEELLAARPDYLIVDAEREGVRAQGTEMLHHPLLRSIPRLQIPEAWTVCGGPAYVRAAQTLSAQLAARRATSATRTRPAPR